jgi:carboxyl-terminal processing protease
MPKRSIILLVATCLACLACWAAREQSCHGRRFGEVIAAIERRYLHETDPEELFDAAVDAAVSRLDEHSAYLRGSRRAELTAALDQRFAGVGLELALDKITERPVVASPIYASPAWRAGIAPGDTIVAIDGKDTRGRPLHDMVEQLRGRAGETVTLCIESPTALATLDPSVRGQERSSARDVVLTRELIRIESVLGDRRGSDGSWNWMLEGEPGVAYLRITTFGERTAEEFVAACRDLEAEQALRLVILDLRGNPGGLVHAAVDVCDALLDEGTIVSTRGRGDAGTTVLHDRRATQGAYLAGVPMAVLVDGLTSSAAEIVAACLHDSGRGTVVGSRTYGKGTVQTVLSLTDGSGLLKITTAEYLRPSREPIHRHADASGDDCWGVKPDDGFEVAPTAEVTERLRAWRRRRDAITPPGAASQPASESARAREVDPVIARALELTAAP